MKKIKSVKFIKFGSVGTTLIELLLYLGLFSVMTLILAEVFLSVLDVQLESRSTSRVEEDGRFILARLDYDIVNAQAIVSPPNLGDQSNTLEITVNSTNYTYTLSNSNLTLINNNGTNSLNSFDTSISNLSFTRLGELSGKPSVRILYTVSSRVSKSSGVETKSYQTTIGLR